MIYFMCFHLKEQPSAVSIDKIDEGPSMGRMGWGGGENLETTP